jgi:proton-translocating NADH-quinone oxidoreductase chain N
MLTQPIDILFFFAVTVPFIGVLESKVKMPYLTGVYSALGMILSGYAAYEILMIVGNGVFEFPIGVESFYAYMRIDALGIYMALVQLTLGILGTIYSIRYMENDSITPLYYSLLLAMIAGMIGIVFSGDLFTLFVFWELLSITSYILVAWMRSQWEPIEAGLKYLVMGSIGSVTALFGLSLLYGLTGSLHLTDLSALLSDADTSLWFHIIFLMLVTGFAVKAAIVPLHTWLPDAHSAAPSPVSALLSGVVIETALYVIIRITFTVFPQIHLDWTLILAFLSIATMTLGNLTALLQTDIKRMLAYSSIGHMGYMLIGLVTGTQIGLTGTFFHFFSHMLMKGTAFLCAGAIIFRIGTRNLEDMNGIAKRMPITSVALIVSLFGLIGMPGISGFVGKLILFVSTVDANMIWVGGFLILNSVISAGYYLRVIRAMMQPMSEKVENVDEAPNSMLFPIVLMTVLMVFFGLWPDMILGLIERAVIALFSIT